MSQLLEIVGMGTGAIRRADDNRHLAIQYSDGDRALKEDFSSGWWPSGMGLIGDMGLDVAILAQAEWYEMPDTTRGANTRVGFVGVTADAYGSPLGGVTVKLFRSSDDRKVDQIVSDPVGKFVVGSPYYPDTHYITYYKSGSPDVRGHSTNTLIGG